MRSCVFLSVLLKRSTNNDHETEINFQVPSGEKLTFGDDSFMNFEAIGIKEAQKAAFVLVAGGLGERLGYNGIKVVDQLCWSFHRSSL